jgi:hypothetical protein
MRKFFVLSLVCLAFTAAACGKKEPTPGEKVDNAINAAGEKAAETQKKVEDATKK